MLIDLKEAKRYKDAAENLIKRYCTETGENYEEVYNTLEKWADPFNVKLPGHKYQCLHEEAKKLFKSLSNEIN